MAVTDYARRGTSGTPCGAKSFRAQSPAGRPDGALALAPVKPLDVKLDAESSYTFSYQIAGEPGHWYARLGARRRQCSVEVSTAKWRPLGENDVQAAVDAAAVIIQQVLERAGR